MKYCRLSKYKIKKIIECFNEDITASSAAKILKINAHSRVKCNSGCIFKEVIMQHLTLEQRSQCDPSMGD